MVAPSLDAVRRTLGVHKHRRVPIEGAMKKAAVAAIVREAIPGRPEILFIRRAEHPNDPWSGHMAFPGGRVDPEDKSELDAAIRETMEEIALDLGAHGRLIGHLSHLPAMARGGPLPMVVIPFVFELSTTPELRPKSDEVDEAVWVPLSYLLDQENRSTMKHRIAGLPVTLPCYRYEGRVIWGLTLRVVDELLALLLTEA